MGNNWAGTGVYLSTTDVAVSIGMMFNPCICNQPRLDGWLTSELTIVEESIATLPIPPRLSGILLDASWDQYMGGPGLHTCPVRPPAPSAFLDHDQFHHYQDPHCSGSGITRCLYGVSLGRIRRHILPNLLQPLVRHIRWDEARQVEILGVPGVPKLFPPAWA